MDIGILFWGFIGILCASLSLVVFFRCMKKSPEHQIIHKLKCHMDLFVDTLNQKFPEDQRVARLYTRYQTTKLFESNNHETYTLNKGEKIVMCIRNYAKDNQIHDDFNLLVFVGLHELTHIMCESIDHTSEFWTNFKFILRQAAEMKLYDPVDYALDPVMYCSMVVYDNPYFYERSVKDFIEQLQNIIAT